MTPPATSRADALAPIETAVNFICVLLLVLFALVVPAALFSSGSVLGLGDSEACASTRTGLVPYFVADGARPSEGVEGLRSTGRSYPERLTICNRAPSGLVESAHVADSSTDFVLLAGFLLLTRRLIRTARDNGLFTAPVASRTRTLGWFLLLGSLVAAGVGAVARGIVVSSVVRGVSWTDAWLDFRASPTLILVGIGVLTVARVLRNAAALQEDVDATI